MNDDQRNAQIEKIANEMLHDNLSVDEEDESKFVKYKDQVKQDCGLNDEDSMKLVYEALLYRKMKTTSSHDYLEKGNEFGAGFS